MGFFDRFTKKKENDRAEVVQRYRALLMKEYTEATMTEMGSMEFKVRIPGRPEITVFLENMVREALGGESKDIDAIVERFFKALLVSTAGENEEVRVEQIVPMIKDQLYLDQGINLAAFAKEHLVADLWIVYAIDLPTKISTLKEERLTELGVERSALRGLAVENLRRILPEVEMHGGGPWFLLTAGDYTASVLLMDEVWENVWERVDGDIVVVVPARDIILMTGSESAEGIAAIKEKAREIQQTGCYAVSDTLLRRTRQGWVGLS